jgi:hypothetical protein
MTTDTGQSFTAFYDTFMRRYYPGLVDPDQFRACEVDFEAEFYSAFSHAVAKHHGSIH